MLLVCKKCGRTVMLMAGGKCPRCGAIQSKVKFTPSSPIRTVRSNDDDDSLCFLERDRIISSAVSEVIGTEDSPSSPEPEPFEGGSSGGGGAEGDF